MKEMKTENREQELCVACGLCCQDVLFLRARVKDTDEDRELAENLGLEIEKEDGRESFKLPCRLFKDHNCSVYHSLKRPCVCRNFVCRLIHMLRKGEIEFETALSIVKEAAAKVEQLKIETAKFDAFNGIEILRLPQVLNSLKKETEEAAFRRMYGKIIILNYTLTGILKKYFRKPEKKATDHDTMAS